MQTLLLIAMLAFQLTQPTGVVSGRITLSDGKPAAGMRVSAMLAPDASRPQAADAGALFSQAQADADGRYRLEGVPPGRYYIVAGRVDSPTYYPGKPIIAEATAVTVASARAVDRIDFTMTEVSTRIPAAGGFGLVFSFSNVGPDISLPVVFSAEPGLPLPLSSAYGRVYVTAKPTPGALAANGGSTLRWAATNNGMTNTYSVAANGVTVFRISSARLQPDGTATVKVTAGEYNLAVENLPENYEIRSMSAGGVDLLRNGLRVGAAGAAQVRVVVGLKNPNRVSSSGRKVTGRVIDSTTQKDGAVENISLSGTSGTLFSDGSFEFPGVAKGKYRLEAYEGLPGDRVAQQDVIVDDKDVAANPVYAGPPARVRFSGRIVVANGSKPSLVRSRIVFRNTGTPVNVADDGTFNTTLADGEYILDVVDLPAGLGAPPDQTVTIRAADGPVAPPLTITLSVLPRVTFRGRVVAVPPTRPVEGAVVILSGAETFRTIAAADGSFELKGVFSGNYTLFVRPFGFANVSQEVVVGDKDTELEVKAEPLY